MRAKPGSRTHEHHIFAPLATYNALRARLRALRVRASRVEVDAAMWRLAADSTVVKVAVARRLSRADRDAVLSLLLKAAIGVESK